MTTRDPRTDPQPSDELRGIGRIWRVMKREDQRVLVSGPRTPLLDSTGSLAGMVRKERDGNGAGGKNEERGKWPVAAGEWQRGIEMMNELQ